MIHIRKIDIDQCSREDGDPPLWAKVKASIGGGEVQLTLNDEQARRLTAAAEPIVAEIGLRVADAMERGNVLEIHPSPAA
jgi:hypothetical protein